MRLVITRPQEDAVALAKRLESRGHEVIVDPLLEIQYLEDAMVPDRPYRAILVSSAHAARRLGALTAGRRDIPVLAVGDRTAEVARQVGFTKVTAAEGDARSLLALALKSLSPTDGPLLYCTGRDIARDLKADLEAYGFDVDRSIIYEALTARQLSPVTINALSAGWADGVVLLSPRTATTWHRLAVEAGVAEHLSALTHFCLSDAVANALNTDRPVPLRVTVAAKPSLDSMMQAICQT